MTEEGRFLERADRDYEKQRDERAWIRKLIDDGKIKTETELILLMDRETRTKKAAMLNYLTRKQEEKKMGL